MLDWFRVYAVLPASDLPRAKASWEEKVEHGATTTDWGGVWEAPAP
jgi:hypothetical protein